jgi:hypothetical protein
MRKNAPFVRRQGGFHSKSSPSRETSFVKQYLGAAAMAALLACSGCGGGGGGTDTGGGAAPPSGTGLVPAPGALGATLVGTATDIRPVALGAEWTFHSSDVMQMGPGQIKTTAISAIPNGVIEVDSDDPLTNVSTTVDPANGSVFQAADVPLAAGGATVHIGGYELRSPVRQNDQYVLLDQHVTDSGLDVDGDGRADALDIAAWRTVVGTQIVTPPQGTAMSAVRVDLTVALRATPSAGGAPVTQTQTQSIWYAAGIGPVRRVTYSGSTTTPPYATQTWLTGFDGITHGWGAVVRRPQYVGSSLQQTGSVYSAVRTADGALALTGFYLLRVGKDGVLSSAVPLSAAGYGFDGGTLASTTAGLRYVNASNQNDIRITTLNDDGTLNPVRPVAHIDLAAYNPAGASLQMYGFTATPGGDRFWVGWRRTISGSGVSTDQLLVRSFDPDGTPISPEIVLPSSNYIGPAAVMTATPTNGILVTWSEYGSSIAARAQTRLDAAGQVIWSSREDGADIAGGGPNVIFPLFDEGSTWLGWRASYVGDIDRAHGVRLNAVGSFVGVGTVSSAFSSEELTPLNTDYLAAWPHAITATQGHFHAMAQVLSSPYGDTSPSNHLEYTEFDAGPDSLMAGLAPVRRLPLVGLVRASQVPPIVFGDRVLLLTDDGATLQPAVIWR